MGVITDLGLNVVFCIFANVKEYVKDFVDALEQFVRCELVSGSEPADYNSDSVQVVDARNALFRNVGKLGIDEEHDIYAIRSLCRIDEATMDIVPDRGRIESLARNYFHE